MPLARGPDIAPACPHLDGRMRLDRDTIATTLTAPSTVEPPVEWTTSDRLVPYPEAVAAMEARVAAIAAGEAPEQVWLLEHPHLYSAGTSAKEADLVAPDRLPVFRSGRGGEFTYHGP